MPFYNDLRPAADFADRDFIRVFPQMTKAEKLRTIDGILRIRAQMEALVPPRRTEDNLLVASWNIKEFGHTKQRLPEAYYYIAEILGRFDLIALQEIKSTLKGLETVKNILGPDWSYLVTDLTGGKKGNHERAAYLYNTKRVKLSGLAGELVIWPELFEAEIEITQLQRTPYMIGFTAGWKSFVLMSVHLAPGDAAAQVKTRQAEVKLMLKALREDEKSFWGDNLIVTGDFNFYRAKDAETVAMFEAAGFEEISSLAGLPSTASDSEIYDRFFMATNEYFRLKERDGKASAGVLNPFQQVFRLDDYRIYRDYMLADYGGEKDLAGNDEELKTYFDRSWQQNQLSDHLPIWFELETDSSAPFLADNRQEIEADA